MSVISELKIVRIPTAYQEVEYIENSGTQYIDIGVTPTYSTSVDITYSANNYSGVSQYILGSRKLVSSAIWYAVNGSSATATWDVRFNNNSYVYNSTMSRDSSKFQSIVTLDKGQGTWKLTNLSTNESESRNLSITAFTADATLHLFSYNKDNVHTGLKIYSCKIYESNTLIRNLIPCYRKSDNVAGMYDALNKKFYENQGAGVFITGADIAPKYINKVKKNTLSKIKINKDNYNFGKHAEVNGKNLLEKQVYIEAGSLTSGTGTVSGDSNTTSNRCRTSFMWLEAGSYVASCNNKIKPSGQYIYQYTEADENTRIGDYIAPKTGTYEDISWSAFTLDQDCYIRFVWLPRSDFQGTLTLDYMLNECKPMIEKSDSLHDYEDFTYTPWKRTLYNCLPERLVGVNIEGKSIQPTSTGKNLFNIKTAETLFRNGAVKETKTESGYILTNANTTANFIIVKFDDTEKWLGKTLRLSCDMSDGGYAQWVYFDENGENRSAKGTTTITVDDTNTCFGIRLNAQTTDTSVIFNYSNIQIEEGEIANAWEPFTGGAAGPNIDYPIQIKSIGDKTKNLATKLTNINSSGGTVTNTMLMEEKSKIVNSSLIKVTPGKTYTLSRSINGHDFRYFIYDTKPVLLQTISIAGAYLAGTQYTHTLTVPENGQYLFVRWSEGYDAGDVQIVEGTVVPDYEPAGYKIGIIQNRLPDEYQELNYLESTDAQYIDTEFIPDQNTKVYSKFQLSSIGANYPFGVRLTSQKQICYISGGAEVWNFRFGAESSLSHGTTDTEIHEIEMSIAGIYFDNTLIGTPSSTEFKCPGSLYLFAINNNNAVAHGDAKIFSFKMWDNDILIRDYIPCIRKKDNIKGLYDLIECKFYQNKTTTDLISGNEINTEIKQNIYLKEPLRQYNDYKDILDLENNKVIRNVKHYEFTGDEYWGISSKSPGCAVVNVEPIYAAQSTKPRLLCDRLISDNTREVGKVDMSYTSGNPTGSQLVLGLGFETTEETVAYIKDQYSKGTPVYVEYPLYEAEEEIFERQNIITGKGTITIWADSELQPDDIKIKYWKQK